MTQYFNSSHETKYIKALLTNKVIPERYKKVITTALAHYPSLKESAIVFKLTNKHPVPYGTTPDLKILLTGKRQYTITLLEDGKEPELFALFRNLPELCQVAVISHELGHVMQFERESIAGILKMLVLYPIPYFKRQYERGADLLAIDHGCARGLYEHATYIRKIPGYLKKRPGLNRYYLLPDEILRFVDPA